MKNQVKKNFSYTAQHRMIVEMINAGFRLAEKLGRHPLTKGCNCIACVNRRKRIFKTPKTDWKFKL
jgi:hypothetical protein